MTDPRAACSFRRLGIGLLLFGLAAAVALPSIAAENASRALVRAWSEVVGDGRAGATQPLQVIIAFEAPPAALREGVPRPAAAVASDQSKALETLRARGIWIHVGYRYTNAINGISATVRSDQMQELRESPLVAGVFRVRRLYPAAIVESGLAGIGASALPLQAAAGSDGAGATISLLDGPVATSHAYLAGGLEPAWNAIRGEAAGQPEAKAADHGTAMAGIVIGHGGPAGLHGVASAAHVRPVQVLELQRGKLLGSTATLLAGIDHALDPNRDGDLTDHDRILLAPVAEPFAAFGESPETIAARGVEAAGSVLITAVGNDGPTFARFGSVAAPAASPNVLAVGATDGRTILPRVASTLQIGDQLSKVDATPLVGLLAPVANAPLALVVPRDPRGDVEADYRAADGSSLVTGKAALVERDGGLLLGKALSAIAAGARALVLYGDAPLVGGALGLDDRVTIPVLAIPQSTGVQARAALSIGGAPTVTFSTTSIDTNADLSRVAAFSSSGLAFNDGIKPDLVAPGVAITTSLPDGVYGAVTGTSVAAAQVAGAAALVWQARADLTPLEVRAALVGSAHPVDAASADGATGTAGVERQGGGSVDIAAASATTLFAAPSALSFGAVTGTTATVTRPLALTNHGAAPVTVALSLTPDGAADAGATAALSADSVTATVANGETKTVNLTIALAALPATPGVIGGWIVVTPSAGPALRVPWATAISGPRDGKILRSATLSNAMFAASAKGESRSLLTLAVGSVTAADPRIDLVPLTRLTVDVMQNGQPIGRIVDEQRLLPGVYRYGISGLTPQKTQATLAPGSYTLRVSAVSIDAANAEQEVPFTITK